MKISLNINMKYVAIVAAFAVVTGIIVVVMQSQSSWMLHATAKLGSAESQHQLGYASWNGLGVDEDKSDAVRWWRKAAAQEHADAQYNLGVAYYFGVDVDADKSEAVRWWHKAADQGVALAQYNLGHAYAMGDGVAEDKSESVRWYQKSAEQGHAKAQYNLGMAYQGGQGVVEDKREGVRWIRKVAEHGDALAQYGLGRAYDLGHGVAKNKREAARWYHKAAKQGLVPAQSALGSAYYFSWGVAVNLRESLYWRRKAADQGSALAQYNLGFVYQHGGGVVANMYEAYVWYSIAEATDTTTYTPSSGKFAAEALRSTNWHDFMTESDIRSAKKEVTRRMEEINLRMVENKVEESMKRSFVENRVIGNLPVATAPKSNSPAARVFEKVRRSVVVVQNGGSQGSGVIVRPNVVATNCHVVDRHGEISVHKSDKRSVDTDTAFSARVRHADRDKDFCLLEVNGLQGVPATVRKYETLGIGENVYGLGAPRGLDLSLSDGVISQLREIDGARFIQTNVAISPGSSGGGLFDSDGNLIGITTAKISGESTEGIGFAIPADLVLGN